MYSNHYHSDDPAPAVRDFVTKYEKRFGARPDSLAALGYDAMRVLAVTGTITFDGNRNPIGKRVVIDEIQNGKLILRSVVGPE